MLSVDRTSWRQLPTWVWILSYFVALSVCVPAEWTNGAKDVNQTERKCLARGLVAGLPCPAVIWSSGHSHPDVVWGVGRERNHSGTWCKADRPPRTAGQIRVLSRSSLQWHCSKASAAGSKKKIRRPVRGFLLIDHWAVSHGIDHWTCATVLPSVETFFPCCAALDAWLSSQTRTVQWFVTWSCSDWPEENKPTDQ